MGTNFFTNEKENTLLEKIEGVFKYKKVHFFDALVGYFRASGYFHIRKFIQQTPKIRILVVINAIVHNDYSFEVPPKFEIFPDRLEITSAGRLPESLTREEFFNGISIPRNKELMRIYRDVELVESLGSGIPRILRAYGEDCFKFTDNIIRITLPISAQDGTQSAPSRHLILKTLIN